MTNSKIFVSAGPEGLLPRAITPRVDDDVAPPPEAGAVKSPNLLAFPLVAIVTTSMS